MILFERCPVRILAGTRTVMVAGAWDQCGFVKGVGTGVLMFSGYPETWEYVPNKLHGVTFLHTVVLTL
jgi:hypothetical protein